jgi:hypothetical protein
MKTATLPPVRIEPAFRQQVEEVLQPGETLTQLVESAVRAAVAARKSQADLRRGIRPSKRPAWKPRAYPPSR